MRASTKRLLVEGMADVEFYSAYCREVGILDLWIGPPKDFAGTGTGKGNAISLLTALLDEIEQGKVTQLGIIVDADYAKAGGLGYAATLSKIEAIFQSKGYYRKENASGAGHIFENADLPPKIGLWVMPGVKKEGYLEDFIIENVAHKEGVLLKHAGYVLGNLPLPAKYKPLHSSKAQVATWLAWQVMPGQGLHSTVGNKLIDINSKRSKEFATWLKTVFS